MVLFRLLDRFSREGVLETLQHLQKAVQLLRGMVQSSSSAPAIAAVNLGSEWIF